MIIAVAVAGLNWSMLTEAYGAGPPYYDMTTNMDKWTSPWVLLGPVDLMTAAIIIYAFTKARDRG